MQMVMTSDETQIQIFANWPMSRAKRVTRDNRKNAEYRVIAAIRNELVDYSRAPCLGADQKPRGLWERDWVSLE